MTVTSGGNVGIGTSSPATLLHVNGAVRVGNDVWHTSNDGRNRLYFGANDRTYFGSGNGYIFRSAADADLAIITNAGNVGIGTTSPAAKLDVTGGKIKMDAAQTLTINPADNFTYDAKSMSNYGLGWYNDSWNGFGSTGWISGWGGLKFFTEGALRMSIDQGGTTRNTSGAWVAFSDARIKTVTNEFTDGLDVIKKIRPVKFKYNENAPFKSNDEQIGIVAQELEKVAPYMVKKEKHEKINDLRAVNNQAYTFLLINAVKEQQAQIEILRAELAEIKGK
jgi:hypothetical protein